MVLKKTAIVLALSVFAAPPAGQAQEDKTQYHYCFVGKPPYGNPLYFSEAFGAKQSVDVAILLFVLLYRSHTGQQQRLNHTLA